MKIIILLSIAFLYVLSPAYGESLSDATGLVNRLNVDAGGHTFEVQVVSNFDISDFEFNVDEKRLTLYIASGLNNNLGEVQIPRDLLSGNFTFNLNDQQFFPKLRSNEKISFVTLNFTGSGDSKLDIFGTTYLSGLTEMEEKESIPIQAEPEDDYSWLLILAGSLCVSGLIIMMKRRKKSVTK